MNDKKMSKEILKWTDVLRKWFALIVVLALSPVFILIMSVTALSNIANKVENTFLPPKDPHPPQEGGE